MSKNPNETSQIPRDRSPQPESELLVIIDPKPGPWAYRLVCRFGWNDETTRSFWSRRFEVLVLSGGRDQAFRIPDLGEKAFELKSIKLGASGVVEGLEQFRNLEHIYVDA